MDYIPLLRTLPPHPITGLLFHLTFATLAFLILYYILKKVDFHHSILMYIIWNTIGGGLLYGVTIFSKKSPAITDIEAWAYWTAGHTIFGLSVGILIHILLSRDGT